MKKMIFLAASAAFFVSSVQADDVVPNHIRHPLHVAAVKALAPKSVIRMGATAANSAAYAPTLAPGGLSSINVIAGLSWSALLGDTATYADNSVQQADIGSTVAGLDTTGNVRSPLSSGGNLIGGWQAKLTPDLFSQGYESNLMGGVTAMGSGYLTRSLFLQTDPYSNYSSGCGLVLSMMGSVGSHQFPISQQDFRGGASAVVGVGGYDTVASCILNGNQPARFVFTVSGYTANSVKLAAPLSAGDAARIYPGMYITTNSPNPSLSLTNTDGELPKKNLFAGFVSKQPAAGDTSIGVYAWDVPGYGTGASGQVPQTTALDTVWSARNIPTVWLGGGAAGSSFTNNWFTSVDVNDLKPSATNRSLVHQFTPIEMDLNLVNGTAPAHSVWWQGISMNAGNQPEALTTDSRDLFLGGDINHHLITNGGCGNWDFESLADGGFNVLPSLCNLSTDAKGVSQQVAQSWTNWVASANRVTTMLWTDLGNKTSPNGWQQAVIHLGVTVDGNRVQTGDYGGSKQGDIEWNRGGNFGSISLCGYSQTCGYRLNGDGTSDFSVAATFHDLLNTVKGIYGVDSSGGNLVQFYPLATGDWKIGTSVLGGGSIRGVNTYFGSAVDVNSLKGGGLDLTGNGYLENGNALVLKPTSVDNGLLPGLYGLNSYTLAAIGNTSADIGMMASSFQAALGGTSSFATAPTSILEPDGHGNWTVGTDGRNVPSGTGGALKPATYTLSSLPTKNETDGNQLWCSDCKLNGITGLSVYWHASVSKWTDSQNGTLAN